MHTTTAQNQAHRNDIQWIKSKGRNFHAAGESFISEYLNPFTGEAIRKSWKMTGRDWFIFDADGAIDAGHATLTFAKYAAATR